MTHIRLADVAQFGNVALSFGRVGTPQRVRTRAIATERVAPEPEPQARAATAPSVESTPTDKMMRSRHSRGRG
jgi:hypothetical protein